MMQDQSLDVLAQLLAWQRAGCRAVLVTVLDTYGTSPRPAGSLAAIREDGAVAGSVSGGCVEDVLTRHVMARWAQAPDVALPRCERLCYGQDEAEQARLRLPCGKQVHLSVEYGLEADALAHLVQALRARQTVVRTLDYADGRVELAPAGCGDRPGLVSDAGGHSHVLGPASRLILIGANDVAAYLAQIALTLDFDVTVCEPRAAYRAVWRVPGVALVEAMPDDLIRGCGCDARTAVVAVSHDPKLDDLALIEALALPCFYVGVVGSRASAPKRRERLSMFDVTAAQMARLHSPAGLPLGSRTPAQIAVSVAGELLACQQALPTAGPVGRRRERPMSPALAGGICRA